jgi:hypothetical protein
MTQVMTQPRTAESFDLDAEHDALRSLPIEALRRRYLEVGGHATRTRNREYLVRRILWLRQAAELGGLSERALGLARELAAGGEVRATPPVAAVAPPAPGPRPARDGRLPCPGHAIVRRYPTSNWGETLRVTVLANGFEFRGDRYGSLSAIAKAVPTCAHASHVNGFRFFRLLKVAAA